MDRERTTTKTCQNKTNTMIEIFVNFIFAVVIIFLILQPRNITKSFTVTGTMPVYLYKTIFKP